MFVDSFVYIHLDFARNLGFLRCSSLIEQYHPYDWATVSDFYLLYYIRFAPVCV